MSADACFICKKSFNSGELFLSVNVSGGQGSKKNEFCHVDCAVARSTGETGRDHPEFSLH